MPDPDLWILDHADIMGGGQLFALRLARFVAREQPGRRCVVVCPRDSELSARCAAAGIETRDARLPAPVPGPALARAALRLPRALAGRSAGAIIVGNTARAQAVASAALWPRGRRVPFVHLMHERESADRATARFVYRRFGALAVVGTNAARSYRAALPGVHVEVLNNFLDFGDGALGPSQLSTTPRRRPPALGVLGRLIPEKGILELVGELAAAPDAWSELSVAGGRQDEAYAHRVERLIGELGLSERIRLVGEVADVAGFLRSVDALVVPSTGYEAQPTVILEALAHARPVLVRAPVFSPDFAGLPVAPYTGSGDLAERLRGLPSHAADREELARRFGPRQALEALESAARRAAGAPHAAPEAGARG